MRNAWEYEAEYSPKGKVTRLKYSIGPIVIWAVVALVAFATGATFLPPGFWGFFH